MPEKMNLQNKTAKRANVLFCTQLHGQNKTAEGLGAENKTAEG